VSDLTARVEARSHQAMSIVPGLLAVSVLEATSLGVAWLQAMQLILQRGQWIHDGPDRLIEIRPLVLRIASVDEDDPIITSLADQGRIQLMLRKYASCDILPEYKISYGSLLYNNEGVDQIEWVIKRLLAKPETKAATITLHRAGETELSCLSLLDFKLRDNRLEMTAVYRSQNVFASQPGNIMALRRIQCHVASRLGLEAGMFDLLALSAHIYESDIEHAQNAAANPSTVPIFASS
jgi:thymidylate synthase